MFDIGGPELVLIIVIALVVVGPRRLPEVGRQIGRALATVRRASREMRTNLEREVALEQVREDARSISRSIESEIEGADAGGSIDDVRTALSGIDGEASRSEPRPRGSRTPAEPPSSGADGTDEKPGSSGS